MNNNELYYTSPGNKVKRQVIGINEYNGVFYQFVLNFTKKWPVKNNKLSSIDIFSLIKLNYSVVKRYYFDNSRTDSRATGNSLIPLLPLKWPFLTSMTILEIGRAS